MRVKMFKEALILVCIAKCIFSQKMEPFIVGGKPAAIQYFGHSAFVTMSAYDGAFICGASILNQRIILSAAHCFEGFYSNSRIMIRAGSANRMKGDLRQASRLAVHKDYNQHTIENDIALVYVKKPFKLGQNIKRVIIMKKPPTSPVAFVAGWGLVDEQRQIESDWLKHAKQVLWTRSECKKELRKIPVGSICGGVKHSDDYASEGDSGSALVIKGSIQIGIVSFKRPEISRAIVVYTDVSYHYNWIRSTALKLHCS